MRLFLIVLFALFSTLGWCQELDWKPPIDGVDVESILRYKLANDSTLTVLTKVSGRGNSTHLQVVTLSYPSLDHKYTSALIPYNEKGYNRTLLHYGLVDGALAIVLKEYSTSDKVTRVLAYEWTATGKVPRTPKELMQREAGDKERQAWFSWLASPDTKQNYLLMALSPQRALNELEKALRAAEILVSDKNVSTKTYYISYLNESEISQWYLSDNAISEKKLERNFSIQLKELESGHVQVEIKQLNKTLEPALKNDLLDLIFEHIS